MRDRTSDPNNRQAHDHQLDFDPTACPLCHPAPYGPTLRDQAQPDELREPPPPSAPRGPRLDPLGRRRASIHSVTKTRQYLRGAQTRTYKLRFPMLRLCGTWLHEAGFHPGRPITIEVQDGRLTIETAS